MVSIRSFATFIYVNATMFSFGWVQACAVRVFEAQPFVRGVLGIAGLLLARNYLLIGLVEFGSRHKPKLGEPCGSLVALHGSVIQTTALEAVTLACIVRSLAFAVESPMWSQMLWFFPLSFWFEVVFDFFHYWGHRALHTNRWLYRHVHKKHHTFEHLCTLVTYYQDPFDLLLTNSAPLLIALWLSPAMTWLQFHVILCFKEYIEISGHCGRCVYPASSFSQFVWLPRALGIQLYSEDHQLHHTARTKNYGKRFALWDKVFGTYQSGRGVSDVSAALLPRRKCPPSSS
jgi:sterol desaturase/sphingolipid hydroxylase (fatty acid hydroxylase superfamily)